ncbi:MAG: hypothetical protein V7637_2873, partial [Mycobacteriales bacterium]
MGKGLGVVQVGGAGPGLGTSPEAAQLGAVIELRVHGVSGTPPEAMLADPWAVRVAGDGLSGFYRRGQSTSSPARPGAVVPEAFSWGSLTSGASARALWLLLLPFALVNVAYWMRPCRTGRLDRLTRWLLRLLALSLTATIVLAAAGVSMNLIAWQCAGPGQTCGTGRSWLRWLSAGYWSEPGRRVLVGALGPAAVIALLWYLGRRTWSSYESVPVAHRTDRPDLPVADPSFWYGRHLVRRLRSIHIAGAVVALGMLLVGPALRADRLSDRPLLAAAGWALLAVLAVFAVTLAGLLGSRRVVDRGPAPRRERATLLARAAAPASLVLALIVAVYVGAPVRARWPGTPALPGYPTLVTMLFCTQAALLLLVTGLVWAQRRAVPAGTALAGFAAPVVASIGLLLACSFSAGVAFRVADFLDGGGTQNKPSMSAVSPLQPPPQYSWASLGFLIALAGLLLLVVAVLASRMRGRALSQAERGYVSELRVAEPGLNPYREDRVRLRRVARTRLAAALTDSTPALIAALVLPGAVIALLMTAAVVLTPAPPAVLAERHIATLASTVSFLTNLGTWLVSGFALALLILGRAAYRESKLRRIVGILWDVGTFWPRGAHPLAPPCYAERAVPDLIRRAHWLATPGPGRGDVLLSAHSQGTILSAAALLQMPDPALARIRLLTYGCPLHRLYTRYFPAYFDATTLTRLDDYLGQRWTNLSRLTDPIGGPVFPADPARHERIDRLLADPVSFGCPAQDTVPPPIRMHSDYWADEAYEAAVQGLLARPMAVITPPPPGAGAQPARQAARNRPAARPASAPAGPVDPAGSAPPSAPPGAGPSGGGPPGGSPSTLDSAATPSTLDSVARAGSPAAAATAAPPPRRGRSRKAS